MEFEIFKAKMQEHYNTPTIRKIVQNKMRPSFKKQMLFKKEYGIAYEFWEDVRSNLTNIPKRGRKRKEFVRCVEA